MKSLPVRRAAKKLGFSQEYLYRLIRSGAVPVKRLQRQLWVSGVYIDECLRKRKEVSAMAEKSKPEEDLEEIGQILEDGELDDEEKVDEIAFLLGYEDEGGSSDEN